MKTELILIRHGESEGNRTQVFCGQTDVPLSELGKKQAELTAEFLKDRTIHAFYASPLSRAYDTGLAAAKLHGLPVTPDDRLMEMYVGKWENMAYTELMRQYPDVLKVWNETIGLCQCPDGENPRMVQERVCACLEEVAKRHEGQTVCIAAHGMVIRTFSARAMNMPLEQLHEIPWAPNASVTTVEYENGEFRMVELGACAHLKDLVTTFPTKLK